MKFLIFVFLLFSSLAFAAEIPLKYSVSVKDGKNLHQFFSKNGWMTDFYQSNLYQGMTIRVGSILTALPSQEKKTWEGRLSDYMVEKILSGRRVTSSYFQRRGLVSPLGMTIHNLGSVEEKIVSGLLEALRTTNDQSIEDNGTLLGTATPIIIGVQRLAVVLDDKCLSISRDPIVAVWMSKLCKSSGNLSSDGEVTINLSNLVPSLAGILNKWLGLENKIQVSLNYSSETSSYVVSGMRLGTGKRDVLRANDFDKAILEALPADTHMFVSFNIPDPQKWDGPSLISFLKADPKSLQKRNLLAVTAFYLGMPDDSRLSMSGLLIKPENFSMELLASITQAFPPSPGWEVKVKPVCSNRFVILSPSAAAIAAVEESCAKNRAQLAQGNSDMIQSFSGKNINTAFVNLSKAATGAFNLGRAKEGHAEVSAEVKETLSLLGRLPAIIFNGQKQNKTIEYQAKMGVL